MESNWCWCASRTIIRRKQWVGLAAHNARNSEVLSGFASFGIDSERWPGISCYDINACTARAACSFGTASSFRGTADSFADCRGLVAEWRTDPFCLAKRAYSPPRGRRVAFSGDEGVDYVESDDGTSMRRFEREKCGSCSPMARR